MVGGCKGTLSIIPIFTHSLPPLLLHTHIPTHKPASDFLVQVLGDRGVHARSAVGTNALPLNVPVEIEMIVELED